MKHNIFLIVSVLLSITSIITNGQSIVTKNDSIPMGQDSIIYIVLPEARGNIQWQKSLDTKNWINLDGETNDTLVAKSDIEAMYRAVVTDGICLPVISDSVGVLTPKTQIGNFYNTFNIGLELISDSTDISNGKYIYIGNDSANELEVGKVIFDEQSGGTIRVINEIIQNGDTVTLQTDQATMEDLFFDSDFKLSTEMIYPSEDLKSASIYDISRLLTDKEGFIHPVEVIYESSDGTILKSASIFADNGSAQGSLHFHKDLKGITLFDEKISKEEEGEDGTKEEVTGNVKAYISEGYFTFDPEIKFEFGYSPPYIKSYWPLKIKKGELKKFKFYANKSKIDFKTILTFQSELAYKYYKEKTLIKNAINAKFKFFVGPIPVWIDTEIDLKSSVTVDIGGEATITRGFSNTNTVTIGAGYEGNQWKTIKDIHYEYQSFADNSGSVQAGIRFVIYPEAKIKLYGVAGPEFKVGPYLKYVYTRSSKENWDQTLDLGVEAEVAAKAELLGKTLVTLPKTKWDFFKTNLWSAPHNLSLIKGDNQNANAGQKLPVIVKVTDSENKPFSNVKVNFQPSAGSVSESTVKTDGNGLASTNWTLSKDPGGYTMKVYLLNGKDEEIPDCVLTVSATAFPALPQLTTDNVTYVTQTSAISGGGVIAYGDSAVTNRGVCWNKKGNPTIDDFKTSDGSGTGQFISKLTGLTSDTLYYVRAYATNFAGTAYGNEIVFKTSSQQYGTFTDLRDGHTYKTVFINGQEWMAENLAYLPEVTHEFDISFSEPRYYVYRNEENNVEAAKATSNYNTYGVLYNYPAAKESCPAGWHLPSNMEWDELTHFLGLETAGIKLKEVGPWYWWLQTENGECTNESGFSGLPGGYLMIAQHQLLNMFDGIGYFTRFWSSAESDDVVSYKELRYDNSRLETGTCEKNWGLSIRCIKDK